MMLMRLDKPIGIILLACPAFFAISKQANPFQVKTLIIMTGIILCRSLGCVLNDIADRDIDLHVKRTALRPLPKKQVSLYQAWILAIFLTFGCLSLLYWIPVSAFKTIIFSGLTILIYPYTKRYFSLPQVFLGISFASSIPVVYSIFESAFSITMYWLFFATVCWVISYDTFYALNDLEDDQLLPIYSLPKTLGEKNSKLLAQILLMVAEIIMIGVIDYSTSNILLVFVSIALVYYIIYDAQNNKINNLDLFHLNGLLGLLWCMIHFNE